MTASSRSCCNGIRDGRKLQELRRPASHRDAGVEETSLASLLELAEQGRRPGTARRLSRMGATPATADRLAVGIGLGDRVPDRSLIVRLASSPTFGGRPRRW